RLARPRALAARVRRLRRLRVEGHDRPPAPVSAARAPDRGRAAVRRPDRRLVHERALALPPGREGRRTAPEGRDRGPRWSRRRGRREGLRERGLRWLPHVRAGEVERPGWPEPRPDPIELRAGTGAGRERRRRDAGVQGSAQRGPDPRRGRVRRQALDTSYRLTLVSGA